MRGSKTIQHGSREHMEIKRSGSQPSGKGQAEYFTGRVRIDPLFTAPDPARAAGASVTFEPGARTAWHPSVGSDAYRHGWPWSSPTLGWSHRRHSSGGCNLVPPQNYVGVNNTAQRILTR